MSIAVSLGSCGPDADTGAPVRPGSNQGLPLVAPGPVTLTGASPPRPPRWWDPVEPREAEPYDHGPGTDAGSGRTAAQPRRGGAGGRDRAGVERGLPRRVHDQRRDPGHRPRPGRGGRAAAVGA